GVELIAGGKLLDNLSLLGGATYLNAELQDAMLKSLNGKQIIGVPEWQYNILLDYLLPISTGTLGFSANFHYTDDRPIDEANTQYASDYYSIDLGARYITKHLLGNKTTFRLTLNNVTNEKYWAGVFAAGSMDGFGTASARGSQLFLGEPRRIIASMQVTF
ncbi:MAG: TonB-dependent receptor domain-containing protein, partial [Sulfurospirillum sp.]